MLLQLNCPAKIFYHAMGGGVALAYGGGDLVGPAGAISGGEAAGLRGCHMFIHPDMHTVHFQAVQQLGTFQNVFIGFHLDRNASHSPKLGLWERKNQLKFTYLAGFTALPL